MTYLDSVYDSIRKREIARNLEMIKEALAAIENYAVGHHIVGGAAEEIEDVARRLRRLARPPAVEGPSPSTAAAEHIAPVPPFTGISRAT